ncbi:MAG: AHH domain-containing protein [Bacteroidales bacterium]|nr:AHH domain-containing protein [Bacteroidales bacterium]
MPVPTTQFVGSQYEDEEIGLYYNRFRYYNPDSGTYVSQDPIRLEGSNPNIYAYVYDVNICVDENGLMPSWMPTKRGYQRHHIIPQSLSNHPAMVSSGMNIDGATNMKYLPVASGIDPNPNKAIHKGWSQGHLDYNKMMKSELDNIQLRSMTEGWDQKRLQQEILGLQHKTRADLDTGKIKLSCG